MVSRNTFTENQKNAITEDEFDHLVDLIASKPEFKEYFGVKGCDLEVNQWWAAYVRQSLEEQSLNNRLPEYLHTCAKIAKEQKVIVPREYIFYDHESSGHLNRVKMQFLRTKLIALRKISGVIFTHQGRLSGEPLDQLYFERECDYYKVKYIFGDAPGGNDLASQATRMLIALGNKLRLQTNRDSNRGGNKGRVISGNVPAGKTTFGYTYNAQYDDLEYGRRRLIKAWWEINKLDNKGCPIWGSEAWVVDQAFHWIGIENHSPYWVAKELNRLDIKPRSAKFWSPSFIQFVIRKRCYTGEHAYNKAHYVPNPNRPLGDITAELKRTIREAKPEEEHVKFKIPQLVSDELWERANQNLNARKGTREKKHVINALLRHRVYCPKCGKLMTVRRYYDSIKYPHFVYYACPGNYQIWKSDRCDMKAGRIDRVDSAVKRKLERALTNPEWAIMQSARHTKEKEIEGIRRQLRLCNLKINQAEFKISTIQDHIERHSEIYTLQEAEKKVIKNRQIILEASKSKEKLETSLTQISQDKEQSLRTKEAFQKIHEENTKRSTFSDWLRIVEILDVKVYPSEDWSEITVSTAIDLSSLESDNQALCYNINIASPKL